MEMTIMNSYHDYGDYEDDNVSRHTLTDLYRLTQMQA